ncbi:ABC transporter substrate-binding protein [Polymorphospora rubra]|uniref:ABC transporter substrate-binding protein n=1 Tax=Polymorphospora rubra TaxID=338584 RepID=UPI003411E56E
MAVFTRPRQALVIASVLGIALSAAACSGEDSSGTNADSPECAAYEPYKGHDGTEVTVYASIRDAEADLLEQSWAEFQDCTGIEINYEGSGEFEVQLPVRVDGGNSPDIALIPQPGLIKRFADAGKLKPTSADTKAMAEKNYPAEWLKYGTVNGQFYGAPFGSNVKSFVWYSPKTFQEKGYTVPTTWQELIALSDKVVADGQKPWCVGIESGEATGWPATDWIEDIMLRENAPEVYDQWVEHGIPFNDPRIAAAFERAGTILKNPAYVNAGYGDVKSISTTSFQEGGLPIVDGKCTLHRQASFYANQWPQGTRVAEDGDVFAFYFPPVDPSAGKPVLGGGEFAAAFADRPEVQAFQTYLASAEHANARAKLGNWVSANKGVDLNNVANPIDKLSVQILQDDNAVFRFDGSDLMPSAVGSGSLWRGMVDWINGKDTASTLTFVEQSWPQ